MEFNFSMVTVINVRIVNEYVDVDDFVLHSGGVQFSFSAFLVFDFLVKDKVSHSSHIREKNVILCQMIMLEQYLMTTQ